MNNIFPLLAIETSDSVCGACVYFSEEKFFSSKLILKHSHAEKLFEVINSVLAMASISQNELKAIAVSNGPGSFTGLRIGMSAAKGIAQALSIPIIPVPTFEALAFQIASVLSEGSTFIISNKVGRDDVYFAKFQIIGNSYIFKEELKIITVLELNLICEDILLFGNAFNLSSEKSKNYKSISAPDPEYIAKWAVTFGIGNKLTDIDFLEPNYLKDFIVKEKKND
jgi:tRNA threonylcarbamoyladenosine biosynthesis protein TsaB